MRGLPLHIAWVAALFGAWPAMAQSRLTIGFEPAEGYGVGTINGQPADAGAAWRVLTTAAEGVTDAGAFSGTQSFHLSNAISGSCVDCIVSVPLPSPAGESGTKDSRGLMPAPGVHHIAQSFWIRTVSGSFDPGLAANISLDDGSGKRMTELRFRTAPITSELIAEFMQGSADAVELGTDGPTQLVAAGLAWGTWYHVRVEADLVDGPDNDVTRVYLSTDGDAGTPRVVATTFEAFFWKYEGGPPAVAFSDMRIDDPNDGFAPQGVYIDDLTLETFADAAPDAGVEDAGTKPEDGGTTAPADAGCTSVPHVGVGCGCGETSGAPLALLLGLWRVGARRRRRGVLAAVLLTASLAGAQSRLSIGFEPSEGYAVGSIDQQPGDGGTAWHVLVLGGAQEGVTDAGAYSGLQSFQWSNTITNGCVPCIVSPSLPSPAGETGTRDARMLAPEPNIRRVAQSFWIRTVATAPDPGFAVNVSLSDGNELRMTELRLRQAPATGKLIAELMQGDADSVTLGADSPTQLVASNLSWGTWYFVRVEADLIDGPDNDVTRVYLSTDADAGAPKVVGTTFESYYRKVGKPLPAICASAMRIDDRNHGFAPKGVFLDELTLETFFFVPPDAGSSAPDAGMQPKDAGVAVADGGFDGGFDGGADAGGGPCPVAPTGCSSAYGGGAPLALLLVLRRARRRVK